MSTTVGSGVTLAVSTTVAGIVVDSGGTLEVVAGGVVVNSVISSGGSATISAQGSAASLVVSGGASLAVTSGGSAFSATIAGELTVGDSAFVNDAAVVAGGTVTVASGGVLDATKVSGGSVSIASGGSAVSDTFASGATLDVVGGAVLISDALPMDLTVGSGLVLSMPGITSGAHDTLDAGGAILNGSILGTLDVEAGATLSGNSFAGFYGGGVLIVSSGGVAIAPQMQQLYAIPGTAIISSGGVLSGGAAYVTIKAGGLIAPGAASLPYLTIASGASLSLGGGQSAGSGTIQGTVTVGAGGYFDGSVGSGGLLVVTSGGVAGPVAVSPGGIAEIAAGGIESGTGSGTYLSGVTVLAGGTVMVSDRADAFGLTVAPGGSVVIGAGGSAGPMTLAAGTLTVAPAGSATLVYAGQGAVVTVSSAATAISDGVSGGTLDLAVGAIISGGLVFQQYGYGGDIVIEGTALPSVPISGFGGDETIDLPNIPYDPAGTISVTGSGLAFTENGFDYNLSLVSAGLVGRAPILARDATGGTAIEVPCFVAGTRIATPGGDVAVESLRPGDAVLTLGGAAWRARRVRWVGTVAIDLAQHPRPHKAAPYRILAGAFADGIPARDLLVSPDHALLVDGLLVQAQALANGATIAQEFPAHVSYWHVELDEHAILCAEGMPAESYRDTGNRAQFAGEVGVRPLHPDLSGGAAPMVLAGPRIAAAHARLILRAVSLGYRLTREPALALTGAPSPRRCGAGSWHLAANTRTLRLESRVFVPAWFGADDRRRLGIGVRDVRIGGEKPPETAFAAGWHAAEDGFRWSDGAGRLRLPPLSVPTMLTVELAEAGQRYWVTGTDTAAIAAA